MKPSSEAKSSQTFVDVFTCSSKFPLHSRFPSFQLLHVVIARSLARFDRPKGNNCCTYISVLSFILGYQCSVTQKKEYSMKKRKMGQKESCFVAQFVPPSKITNFICSSTDLGRWSVTCVYRAACGLWVLPEPFKVLWTEEDWKILQKGSKRQHQVWCLYCTMTCSGWLLVGGEVLRNRITSLSAVEGFALF